MDTEDFDALEKCVKTNNLKQLQKHVRRLKGQNVFFWNDYEDLVEMVLPSKNKEMIESMLPLVPAFFCDYYFMRRALEEGLPRDIIEILQPPSANKEAKILKYFVKYNMFDALALWSKKMNSPSLDEKISKLIAPVMSKMTDDEHEQYLKNLVRQKITEKEHKKITSRLSDTQTKTSGKPRKM